MPQTFTFEEMTGQSPPPTPAAEEGKPLRRKPALAPPLAEQPKKPAKREPAERQVDWSADEDMSDKYNTPLPSDQRRAFAEWKAKLPEKQQNEWDYDLQGAFLGGAKPGKDGHLPDQWKKPNHPTFSEESKYSKEAPERAGRWEGGKFYPGKGKPREAAAPDKGPKTFTFDEMTGKGKEGEENYAKSAVQIAAPVVDAVLGLGSGLAKIGMTAFGKVAVGAEAVREGKTLSTEEISKAGEMMGDMFGSALGSPVEKLMQVYGKEKIYSESDLVGFFNKIGQWGEKGGEWVEKNLGVSKYHFKALYDTVVNVGPFELAHSLISRLKGKPTLSEDIKSRKNFKTDKEYQDYLYARRAREDSGEVGEAAVHEAALENRQAAEDLKKNVNDKPPEAKPPEAKTGMAAHSDDALERMRVAGERRLEEAKKKHAEGVEADKKALEERKELETKKAEKKGQPPPMFPERASADTEEWAHQVSYLETQVEDIKAEQEARRKSEAKPPEAEMGEEFEKTADSLRRRVAMKRRQLAIFTEMGEERAAEKTEAAKKLEEDIKKLEAEQKKMEGEREERTKAAKVREEAKAKEEAKSKKEERDEAEENEVYDEEAKAILEKPGFLRTAAERLRLRRWELQAMLGAAGGAALAYTLADDDTKKRMYNAGVDLKGAAVIPLFTLEAILGRSPLSSKMLERLPKNRTAFPKAMIESEIGRQDISKPEREIFRAILDNHPGNEISSRELMQGFRLATDRFTLSPLDTRGHAETGLDSIRPVGARVVVPRTTVWRLPDAWGLPRQLHFGAIANVFGHTRGFAEGAFRYVMEIQSDLYQLSKDLPPDRRQELERRYQEFSAEENTVRNEIDGITSKLTHRQRLHLEPMDPDVHLKVTELRERQETLAVRRMGLRDRLAASKLTGPLASFVKFWQRRLIQEELSRAGRAGTPVVMFPTPETIVKVENFNKYSPRAMRILASQGLTRLAQELADAQRGYPQHQFSSSIEALEDAVSDKKREIAYWKNLEDKGVQSEYPEYQKAVYDHYVRDVQPYLKSLGATPHTDSYGHTWWKVSSKRGSPLAYGYVRPELMGLLAGAGIGGILAYKHDKESPIRDSLVKMALKTLAGAAVGAVAGEVAVRAAINVPRIGLAKDLLGAADPKVKASFKQLADIHQHFIQRWNRLAMQGVRKAQEAIKDRERRKEVSKALDGEPIKLSPEESSAVGEIKRRLSELSQMALHVGALDEVRRVFLERMWKRAGNGVAFNKLVASMKGKPFTILKDGKAAGLTPITEDVAAIYSLYVNSLAQAIANKGLKNAMLRDSTLAMPDKNAPPHFVEIKRPLMDNTRVHPDIAPSVSFLFDIKSPDAWVRGMSMVATAAKRVKVSLSLFHAMALTQAMVGAGAAELIGEDPRKGAAVGLAMGLGRRMGRRADVPLGIAGAAVGAAGAAAAGEDPYVGGLAGFAAGMAIPSFALAARLAAGKDSMLKQLREGGQGDIVDNALRDGLRITMDHRGSVVGDISQDLYSGFSHLQRFVDSFAPESLGKLSEGLHWANLKIDEFMWGRLHAGFKLHTYLHAREMLLKDNLKAREASPDVPLVTERQAGETAARYANALFGGMHWFKAVEGIKNKFGGEIASFLTSPSGMRRMNFLFFAPDWNVSTTLSALRAFYPKGASLREFAGSPGSLGALHRQYMVKAALWTFAMAEAINYASTGKHIWEEDDPTMVHLRDGSTMQVSKHFFEPWRWMRAPGQELMNKLGPAIQEGAEQLAGVQYLSQKGAPPLPERGATALEGAEERVKHALKRAAPFSVGGLLDEAGSVGEEGLIQAGSSIIGMPIYPPKKPPAPRKRKKKTSEDLLEDSLEE